MFLALGFGSPSPSLAAQLQPIIYSREIAPLVIEAYAIHYGIPSKPLIDTLRCESQFNPSAIGDNGNSFGIAQIHLPAHPDVTKQQALDPLWAINWAAYHFSLHQESMWSCWNQQHMLP